MKDFFQHAGLPLTLPAILGVYALILGVHAVASRYQEGLNARMSLGYTQLMQEYTAFAPGKMAVLHPDAGVRSSWRW